MLEACVHGDDGGRAVLARALQRDLDDAVRDALDKKYPGSFIEEAYNDATASLYKVIVKRSDGWSATIILDKEGFIRQASETPAA